MSLRTLRSVTLGMFEFTELERRIVVNIVVMLSAIRAGTALGVIKKQHHDRTTSTIDGTYTDDTKYSNRRRNVKVALRLAKEPVKKTTSLLMREIQFPK